MASRTDLVRSASAQRGRCRARGLGLGVEGLEWRTLLAVGPAAVPSASVVDFSDNDGDRFRLRVFNGGSVSVTDANHDGRAEISLAQTGPASALSVTTLEVGSAGDATLHVESIAVGTGLLRAIFGQAAMDLQGPITPLSGDLAELDFRSISPGATIDVQRDLRRLDVSNDVTFDLSSHLIVGRDLGLVDIDGDLNLNGGTWQVGRDMLMIHVGGDMHLFPSPPPVEPPGPDPEPAPAIAQAAAAPPGFTAGTLRVGRDLGSFQVDGTLTLGFGSLIVQRDLRCFSVDGDLDSSSTGMISVGRRLGTFLVNGDWLGTSDDEPEPAAVGGGTLDLVVGGSPQVGSVGSLTVVGGTVGVEAFVGSRLAFLSLGGGLQDSGLIAGSIGYMTVGTGPRGAIVDSEIDVASRIDSALVNGDMVGSRILANPLTTVDFGTGPALASVQFVPVFEMRQVVITVIVDGHVEVRLAAILVAGLRTQVTVPASLGGQIGSVISPFVLNGNLVDSLLAANWSPGQDNTFDAPPAPRSLAKTSATGDDGVGRGSISFKLKAGFRAIDSGTGANATGLYAKTVFLTPSTTIVETP